MNNRFYMTNESTLLVENEAFFSPISQLNYSFYNTKDEVMIALSGNEEIQCIIGTDLAFGLAQKPGLMDYPDGVDILQFLLNL